MDEKRRIRISKYLSKHLRHQPERLGLTLEPGGWINVDVLLTACAGNNFPITREQLNEVVATSDKRRFAFDETGQKMRANQGHSIEIDLGLQAMEPPPVLYHGTGAGNVDSILRDGLCKMKRHHVHLSMEFATAESVGLRHGKPVVFQIDTIQMTLNGFQFFRAANGVWLVDAVPSQYLQIWEGE